MVGAEAQRGRTEGQAARNAGLSRAVGAFLAPPAACPVPAIPPPPLLDGPHHTN